MKPFDPFTASHDEAEYWQEAFEEPGNFSTQIFGPMHRWEKAQEFERKREYFSANVLDGLAHCFVHDLAPPDWLQREFLQRHDRIRHYFDGGSWDFAFGRPIARGVHLARLRRHRLARDEVVRAVDAHVRADPRVKFDDLFWHRIGREVGVGKTLAQELHAEAVSAGWASAPSVLARGLNGPAKLRKLTGRKAR